MTCGTCPVTARKALSQLAGVYSATVTLPDSLGLVKFDPAKLKPAQIAAHLTKMTGYAAKVLPDSIKTRKS
jgi:copper chaperone CopZ